MFGKELLFQLFCSSFNLGLRFISAEECCDQFFGDGLSNPAVNRTHLFFVTFFGLFALPFSFRSFIASPS